jgi:hypothetical protein
MIDRAATDCAGWLDTKPPERISHRGAEPNGQRATFGAADCAAGASRNLMRFQVAVSCGDLRFQRDIGADVLHLL